MGDVIKLEDFRADFERRRKAKDARRDRQRERLAEQKSESDCENPVTANKDRADDDPA